MKSALTLIAIVLFTASAALAQSLIEVVQKQFYTYNAQNIDGFVKEFSEDAVIYSNLGEKEPSMTGRSEIKERYADMFAKSPENKSTLIGQMVQGNFVFDHEWITGRDSEFKIMAISEIENGQIIRAWFAR